MKYNYDLPWPTAASGCNKKISPHLTKSLRRSTTLINTINPFILNSWLIYTTPFVSNISTKKYTSTPIPILTLDNP